MKRLDILGAISKQIVTINLVMSVRPSVRPPVLMEQRDRNLTISFLGLLIKYVDIPMLVTTRHARHLT